MKILIVLCVLIAAVFSDVSHLPTDQYLPPSHQHAASAPAASYSDASFIASNHLEAASAPAISYSDPSTQSYHEAASSPSVSYSAPAANYESASYEGAASEPSHTFSASGGYRYKAAKRRVIRRQRRDVSHLTNEYLPPHEGAASAPVAQYDSAPSYYEAASVPAASYETAASEPAHSFSSAEGYRYKTAKRRVIRRHRF